MAEKWNDIFAAGSPPGVMPAAPKLITPRVYKPTHPEHCGKRHEVEAVLWCPQHKIPAYQVVAHAWFHTDGHFFYTLEPMNGSPPVTDTKTPKCPDDGLAMVRVSPR